MNTSSWQPMRLLVIACAFFVANMTETAYSQQDQRNPVQMWLLQGQTEEVYLQRMESQGNRSLSEVAGVLGSSKRPLSAEQETKLKLAVQGVMARFRQDLTQLRALTDGFDLTVANEQRRAIEILQPAMQQAQQGWYGKEFFDQTLNRTLDTEQSELLTARKTEQRIKRHRALTLRAVADLDGRLSLTKAQRAKMVELMGQHDITKLPENYESVVGFMKLLRIPEKELAEFLEASQCETLRKTLEPYRNYERMFP